MIFAMYWQATFLRYVLPYGKAFAILDSSQFVILAIAFTTSMVLVTYLSGAYFTFHIDGILSEFTKVAASTFVGIASDCVIIYIQVRTVFENTTVLFCCTFIYCNPY